VKDTENALKLRNEESENGGKLHFTSFRLQEFTFRFCLKPATC